MDAGPAPSPVSATRPRAAYQGFYINLDRSRDRNAEVLQQLEALRLADRYRRFPAVDGAALGAASVPRGAILPGELGCFHSHARVLALAEPDRCLHILEDDVLLSPLIGPLVDRLIVEGELDKYDIIFTDTFVEPRPSYIASFRKLYDRFAAAGVVSVVDLGRLNFCCLASYIVSSRAVGKLQALYADQLRRGPVMPVDIFVRQQVWDGRLRAAVVLPFATSVRLERARNSTIPGRSIDGIAHLSNLLLRQSFFVGRDLERLALIFGRLTNQPVDAAAFLDRLFAHVTSLKRPTY